MAKKGIKVKELARRIGVTSREIIARCRAEGVPVQNSVTRLTPEIERTVLAWFDTLPADEGNASADHPSNR